MSKKISPAIFGIALICFFLPWINVSCSGQKVASFSGIQFMTGTTIQKPQMFGPPKAIKEKGNILAVLTFLCAIAGGVLSLSKGKIGNKCPVVAGVVGVVLLLLFRSNAENDIVNRSSGMLQVNYESGFYLTMLLFLSAIGMNVYLLTQDKKMPVPQSNDQIDANIFCSNWDLPPSFVPFIIRVSQLPFPLQVS